MKLMFFDIDGTLLTEDTHIIPDSAKKALELARNNGHKFYINTGRPCSAIDIVVRDLHPDGYVCGCGTYIEEDEKELFHTNLDISLCNAIRDDLVKCKLDGVLEGKDCVYFREHPFFTMVKEMKNSYIQQGMKVYDLFKEDLHFDKFAVWFNHDSDIETFKKKYEDRFLFIVRADDFYEIVPYPCTKATGIQFLADYHHLSIDDCYVFGDSNNDKPMLDYVKHNIVMGNGNPDLFENAYYVTSDIHDDGIYNALKYCKLI